MPVATIEYKRQDRVSAITLRYYCDDGRLKYSTGYSDLSGAIPPVVAQMKAMIEQTAADYRIAGKRLTMAGIELKLNKFFYPEKAAGYNLFTAFTEVIDKMITGQITTPGKKRYAPGSIKSFRHTARLLQAFKDLSLEQVDMKTYSHFIHWCQNKKYSTNYIGSQIKNWKTLGKAAGGNDVYDSGTFIKITEETLDVSLDETEIKRMWDEKLNARMELARDWFILDCFTGLRVSDLTRLTAKNLSRGYITIANEKTDETVIIPAHKYVKLILKKYKGFPPKVSDQELNRTIKQVAKKAKINSNILFTITKGGVREDSYLKKWQMISVHTGRRTFITNMRKKGVPDSLIMKLTGIKSIATLVRYDKLGAQEAATIAKGHKFFK